jgi:hypothetical protein
MFDNGTEVTGGEFQELLDGYGIKAVSTTVQNPKSNGVIEQVHLTMEGMLQKMSFSGADWFFELQRALDAVAWAVRTVINPAIGYSPSHPVFSQDMIFHTATIVDWNAVHQECSKLTKASNKRENNSRITNSYAAGDKIPIVLDQEERQSLPKMS